MKTMMRQLIIFVVVAVIAGAMQHQASPSFAATVDGITPGVSSWSHANQAIKLLNTASGPNVMLLSGPAARADRAIGLTSIRPTIGETKAQLWLAAADQNNIIQYLRLHITPSHTNHAIELLRQRYQGRSLQMQASDETGLTDIFFYDTLNVAWVREPRSPNGPEIIIGSYDIIGKILEQDLLLKDWAVALNNARASLGGKR